MCSIILCLIEISVALYLTFIMHDVIFFNQNLAGFHDKKIESIADKTVLNLILENFPIVFKFINISFKYLFNYF